MALRSGVQYATITTKRCPMYDDACAARIIAQIAAQYPTTAAPCDCESVTPVHFATCASNGPAVPFDATALVEKQCGRFTRGAHAGKLRGWAEVEICTEGGWKRYGPGERNGRVVYPGTILAIRITDFSGKTYLEV